MWFADRFQTVKLPSQEGVAALQEALPFILIDVQCSPAQKCPSACPTSLTMNKEALGMTARPEGTYLGLHRMGLPKQNSPWGRTVSN